MTFLIGVFLAFAILLLFMVTILLLGIFAHCTRALKEG